MKKVLFIYLCLFAISEKASTQNQVFWGLTPFGGQFGGGTIFTINSNGTGFNAEHQFQPPNGYTPYGNLLQAGNGSLYGTCFNGGSFSSCTIFKFDPTTNTYTDVYDFDITHGDYPRSGLIEASNGKLYGAASDGGMYGGGVIYSLDPVTNVYTDEFDLSNVTGRAPHGCPIEINGILYGLTTMGGSGSSGTLYSYNINSYTYTDLYNFNTPEGTIPYGSLIHLNNGKLYGMTSAGGANGDGVIFSFDPSANVYVNLFDFDSINGRYPMGSLFQANNGLLYGVTFMGGTYDLGVMFSFNTANNSFVKLVDFNGTNGASPLGEVMQGSNGKLYGTSKSGGAYGCGIIYSFDLTNGTLTDIFDFTVSSGYGPTGTFIVVSGATSVEQFNDNIGPVSFYPNPVKDKLTVTLAIKEQGKMEINLINAIGENIYSSIENIAGNSYRKTIDMSKIKSGILFLECIIDGEKTISKLVKQ